MEVFDAWGREAFGDDDGVLPIMSQTPNAFHCTCHLPLCIATMHTCIFRQTFLHTQQEGQDMTFCLPAPVQVMMEGRKNSLHQWVVVAFGERAPTFPFLLFLIVPFPVIPLLPTPRRSHAVGWVPLSYPAPPPATTYLPATPHLTPNHAPPPCPAPS